ncbi:MAG: SDR family oxidoreductase [Anaerolineae bacterium]
MNNMQDRVVIVTGATNGIGEVTARELARMGANVAIIARSESKAQATVAEIQAATNNPNVNYLLADLSLMADVRRVAEEFKARYNGLDVLVNNAGALFTERNVTREGNEMTFALNHLSYFLLTDLLLEMLKATGTPERKARIVNVASEVHEAGKVNFSNLQNEKYSALGAYAASKLENVLFTYELARRLQGENVTANVLHPGVVASGFGKNNSGLVGRMVGVVLSVMQRFAGISSEEGAKTSIYLASSPEVEGVTGKYFDKSQEKSSSAASKDQQTAARLWEISEQLTREAVRA